MILKNSSLSYMYKYAPLPIQKMLSPNLQYIISVSPKGWYHGAPQPFNFKVYAVL